MSRGITDEELIDEINRLAEEIGRKPTASDMNEQGAYSASACQNHFGTWSNALREAGYEPRYARSDSPSEEELLGELLELAERLGRTPKMEDMDTRGEYSGKVYSTRFDSWNDALSRAELETNRDIGLSEERLLSDLQEFTSDYGKTPTRREMGQDGPHSPRPYVDRFGSWNATLNEAGLEINHASHDRDDPITREELLAELQRLNDELERPPTGPEMHIMGRFSHSIYQRKFDTWNDALREAGLDLHDNKGTPNQELMDEIHTLFEELGRVPAAQDMNEKGRYMHSTYQSRYGSWSDAIREAGYEPVWGQSGFPGGEEHPGWKGGHEQYYGPSWSSARRNTRERDDYTCQRCGMTDEEHLNEYGQKLHIHHIKPFRTFDRHEKANKLDNLITLCLDCHNLLEGLPLDFHTQG